MADKAVARLAKPQLRGLFNDIIKRNIAISLILSGASGVLYKILVGDVRKKKYAEFYRNYDAEKEFEKMRQKELFTCC